MVKITFVEYDGAHIDVEAEAGQSLMKAATYGAVAGISADCGGNCACGTCRIYVPTSWRERLPGIKASEQEMLDFWQDKTDGVRLSCQIKVTEEMDGLVLQLPDDQHY